MSLLISWLLISGFDMDGVLYFVSFIVWVIHLFYHAGDQDVNSN